MSQDLRTNIKKTAANLFLKYGLRSVSIDDICNELRISKKTFYTQFGQKEALIEAVLMEHNEKRIRKQDSKLNPCYHEGNAIDKMMAVSAFHTSSKNDQFVNFFYDLHKYYPEIHHRMAKHNRKHIQDAIRESIRAGIEEKLFRSDFNIEFMTNFLTVQFSTVLSLNTKDISKKHIGKSIEQLLDLFIRALCNRDGLDYYESLLAKKNSSKSAEEPMKPEDLDQILDQYMDRSAEAVNDVVNESLKETLKESRKQ